MKLRKILAIATLITTLNTGICFATPNIVNPSDKIQKQNESVKPEKKNGVDLDKKSKDKKQQDPIKELQSKKEWIQLQLKDGKISKEKATKIIAAIDARIKEVEEFNKLTPEQKKEKLIKDFNRKIETKVRDGKIPQDKADELIKMHSDKVNQWDGNGYPMFGKRESGHKFRNKR